MSYAALEEFLLDPDPGARYLLVMANGHVDVESRLVRAVMPGSFNPWHDGHRALWKAGIKAIDRWVYPEIAVVHPDKGTLSFEELASRIDTLLDRTPVVVTRAPLFADKAEALPHGAEFVVGFDTARRILDPRYGDVTAVVDRLVRRGSRVHVGARHQAGIVVGLERIDYPDPRCADVFVPLEMEPVDVSSTRLRAQA